MLAPRTGRTVPKGRTVLVDRLRGRSGERYAAASATGSPERIHLRTQGFD